MKKRIFGIFGIFIVVVNALAQTGPVSIKQITVRGNKVISQDAILAAMLLKEGSVLSQAQVLNDEKAIRDLGYFKEVKVLSRSLSESEAEILVEVEENPIVKEIRFSGNTVLKTEELLKGITQPVGQIFNLRNVRTSADAIQKMYRKQGYLVQIEEIAPLPESPETLNIKLIEQTVNQIQIEGLVRTKPRVLRRLMRTEPGKAFNEKDWRLDLEELYGTQWFDEIKPDIRQTETPGRFDLLLKVKEARTANIGIGATLDARNRIVGFLSFTDNNFMGLGQTLGLNLSQSPSVGGLSASLNYTNRWLDSKNTSLTASVYSQVTGSAGSLFSTFSSREELFTDRRTGGAFSLTRPFGRVYFGSVGAKFEGVKTLSIPAGQAPNTFIQQDGDILTFSLSASRDTRRPTVDSQQGELVRLLIEPGFSNIRRIGGGVAGNTEVLGNNSFVRGTLEARKYWARSVPPDAKIPPPVLAFRARVGAIKGVSPFLEQFFVGGPESIRGYEGQRFWGRRTALFNLEYRYPIQRTFSLTAFIDYGGAWGGYGVLRDFPQDAKTTFHLGYGLGVGVRTPFGPIRVDFGFNEKGGTRTHFSIGTSF